MIVYLVFFLIIALFSIFDFFKFENSKSVVFLLWLVSSLFIGTRSIGPDFNTYQAYYLYVPEFPQILSQFAEFTAFSKFEPLYILVTSIGKTVGLSFEVFHLIFTSVFCGLFFFSLRRYTPYVFVSIVVYVGFAYISGWSAIRQFMAGSIFFYSIKFLMEGRTFKYILLIVLASMFHYSAMVLIAFAFVRNWQLSKLTCFALLAIPLVVHFSGILNVISSILTVLFPFLDTSKVNKWTNEESELITTIFLLWLMVLIFFILNLEKLRNLRNFNFFFNIYIFSFSVYVLVLSLGEFGRINMFNKLLHAVMLPYVIFIFSASSRFAIFCIVFLISIVTFYRDIVTMDEYQSRSVNDDTKFIPYKSWLLNE